MIITIIIIITIIFTIIIIILIIIIIIIIIDLYIYWYIPASPPFWNSAMSFRLKKIPPTLSKGPILWSRFAPVIGFCEGKFVAG